MRIIGGSNNQIGDTSITGSAGNLISGNGSYGIAIGLDTPESTEVGVTAGNSIINNTIGADASSTVPLPNLFIQVLVSGTNGIPTTSTIVGGANVVTQRRGNIIVSGNYEGGFQITPNASGTSVFGNPIGTNSTAANITIGGSTTAAGNRIAFNAGDGVEILSGRDVEISQNRIFANGGLGIDLGANGITLNDVGDGDSGANAPQNFPVLSAVSQVVTARPAAMQSSISSSSPAMRIMTELLMPRI